MTSSQYKGKRITITFPTELFDKIAQMAEDDSRPFSQMVVKLCQEAIKERESK
ncbi:hypothetical protein SD81_017235 [Tolypothrix campylonemoides VB511288]|nr:hypothetical protein SD81_017235 [Tolypothrix campylonemoides VB511288]